MSNYPHPVIVEGRRYGSIPFDSGVGAYLPPHTAMEVSAGDQVSAMAAILAFLPGN